MDTGRAADVSGIVLGASVAAGWLLREQGSRIEEAVSLLLSGEAAVPQLWHLEVRNALLTAERRNRISAPEAAERLQAMESLLVATTDTQPDLESTMTLARAHRLTFYDALYLELALRQQATLPSFDTALLRAADAEGVATSHPITQ